MKKKNLFSKLIDYNNELEKVLEKKDFSLDVKNLLLSMLYKVETAYGDYTKTKVNVIPKETYIAEIINYIYFYCNKIEILNAKKQEDIKDKAPVVNKKDKTIKIYQNEKRMLQAIFEISQKEILINNKYDILKEPLIDFFKKSYIENQIEVIRDFDGWTWLKYKNEIENIYYNLLFQNLIILIGIEKINKLVKNENEEKDYVEKIINYLKQKYGDELANRIYYKFIIIITQIYSQENKIDYSNECGKLIKKKQKIVDKENYMKELSTKIKRKNLKIEWINILLNNKRMLEEEFIKQNEENNNIFSIKLLKEKLIKEKELNVKSINKMKLLMNPEIFNEKEKKLENRIKFLLDISNIDIEQNIIKFQKDFIECLDKKLSKIDNKKDIIDLLYITRYYNFLELNKKVLITNIKELSVPLDNYLSKLIIKAIELKAINQISSNINLNIDVFRRILKSKIIDIENIEFMIIEDYSGYILRILDDESIEYEKKVDFSEIEGIKCNKKIKLFN